MGGVYSPCPLPLSSCLATAGDRRSPVCNMQFAYFAAPPPVSESYWQRSACVCGGWGGGGGGVPFLVVILVISKLCHGQLDAPHFYRKCREVGIRPGGFLAFFRHPNNFNNN